MILRQALAGAAGLLAAVAASAQTPQVHYLRISKDMVHTQTSATVSQPNIRPYDFAAYFAGANIPPTPAPLLSGPIDTAGLGAAWNGGQLTFANGEWRIRDGGGDNFDFANQGALDARFGSGTYTMNVLGTNIALNLGGDRYPNKPVLTLTGGRWEGGKYVVDPRRPFTVSSNVFTAYGADSDSVITVYLGRNGANVFNLIHRHGMGASNNRVDTIVPPNTLVEGLQYYLGISFSAVVHTVPSTANMSYMGAEYRSITNVSVVAQADDDLPPVFPMTVTTNNINATTSTVTAQIQYRPADVGTTASTYVFAVAPATVVKSAAVTKGADIGLVAMGSPKDTPVACVLAQLGNDGQLHAVSAANLAVYASGVLSAQGATVNVLANASTPNVAGATFYIGYGANSTAMMNNGINRSVAGVPGTVQCRPRAPETGWWWNPAEPGRGYSIEARGNKLFMASYFYDATGRATWLVASGPTSLDGSLFTAPTYTCSGGVTLSGAYKGNNCVAGGTMTLAFANGRDGTMAWPGGTVPIERFDIVPGGLDAAPQPNSPESGWWWSSAEDGRGFFIEWQNGSANIAGYMYDEAGNPIWYITVATTPNPLAFNATWWQYGNGMTMAGPFKPAQQVNGNVGPATIEFSSATAATLTLPGGRRIPLTRFRF